jgi:hypothetical protein
MTKLTKQVLIALFALFVLQAMTSNSLPWGRLAWPANPERFDLWQPFTHWFYQDTNPQKVISTLLTWLMVLFFLPPTEESYGRGGVLRVTLYIVVTCGVVGSIGVWTGLFSAGVAIGIMPLITAFITLFGLNRPNATILLFFILPIKAVWIAWGTGLIALLYYLASISEGGSLPAALTLAAWCNAYFIVNSARLKKPLQKWLLRRKQRKVQERLRRFEVHEGGGEVTKTRGWGHDPNEGDDGPIVH